MTPPVAAANEVDRSRDNGWVAENAVVTKSVSGQQLRICHLLASFLKHPNWFRDLRGHER